MLTNAEKIKAALNTGAFKEWLRTKPEDETYDFWCNGCALGQYLEAKGFSFWSVGITDVVPTRGGGASVRIPRDICDAVADTPHTFGDVLDRLS